MPKSRPTTDKTDGPATEAPRSMPATHALATPGWGIAPGFAGFAVGGQTLVLLAGEPEPLENFASLSAAHELYRAGRLTFCDEKGNPAAPPAMEPGAPVPDMAAGAQTRPGLPLGAPVPAMEPGAPVVVTVAEDPDDDRSAEWEAGPRSAAALHDDEEIPLRHRG